MRVVVTSEQRLARTPDGHVWTPAQFSYVFWRRYLEVFDEVRILARVRDMQAPVLGARRVNGDDVTVVAVPHYIGPWQCLRQGVGILAAVRAAVDRDDAVILRIGSTLATCLHWFLDREKRPYGVEVVSDPYDVFAPGVISHPLRPILRRYFGHVQARQCARACGAAYVTERFLQSRYPCPQLEVGVSDVEIGAECERHPPTSLPTHTTGIEASDHHVTSALEGRSDGDRFRLITVASLDRMYKGTDVLLGAVAQVLRHELDVELVIVGDGAYRESLENQAASMGITGRVTFTGTVPGEEVRRKLSASDLFVLPSRTEGLPRALVEAMALGLPCIGSTVGGIPELLEPEDLVTPGDEVGLSRAIVGMLSDSHRRDRAAQRNRAKAREFSPEVLGERRRRFYRHVRHVTDEWLRGRPQHGMRACRPLADV